MQVTSRYGNDLVYAQVPVPTCMLLLDQEGVEYREIGSVLKFDDIEKKWTFLDASPAPSLLNRFHILQHHLSHRT